MATTMLLANVTKYPAFLALGAVAVLLGGLLLIELDVAFETHEATLPPRLASADAAPSPAGATTPPAAQIQNWASVVETRPLFSPSRRPSRQAAGPQQMGLPRLSGIMVTAQARIAVFSPLNAPPIIVAAGARLGDYTVTTISDNSVTVTGPDGAEVLGIDFTNHGSNTVTAADPKVLPGGIDLSQLHIPLPDADNWNGVPMLGPVGAEMTTH